MGTWEEAIQEVTGESREIIPRQETWDDAINTVTSSTTPVTNSSKQTRAEAKASVLGTPVVPKKQTLGTNQQSISRTAALNPPPLQPTAASSTSSNGWDEAFAAVDAKNARAAVVSSKDPWADAINVVDQKLAAKSAPIVAGVSFDSRKPATNPGELAENFGADFMENLQGLRALGSAAAQRYSETLIPKGILQPEKFAQNPYDAMMPYSPIRPEIDIPMAAQMGQGIIDHYNQSYVQPLLRGDGAAIGDTFMKHPLNTILDLPLGGGISKAVNAASKTALAGKIARAARTVPLIDNAVRNVGSTKHLLGAVSRINNQWIDELHRAIQPVREAYEKIPAELRDRVIAAGEMRDMRAFRDLAKNPEVQNFWKLANDTDDLLSKRLIAEGAFTEADHLAAKYGPLLRQISGVAEDALHTPEGLQKLQALKAKLDSQGRSPVYFGLVRKGEASNAAKNRRYIFGDASQMKLKNYADHGLEFGGTPTPQKPQGFTQRRTVGERKDYHVQDAFKAWETRYIQGLRFLKLRDFFGELLKNPELAKGGQVIDLHKFFSTVAMGENIPAESMQYFLRELPEQIRLPEVTARLLQRYTKEGVLSKLGLGNATLKTMMLGADVFWNINQQIQNAMIGAVAMFRSPRDIAASFMAHVMMKDKELLKRLPPHWLGEAIQDAEASGIMETLKKFAPPIHYLMEKNFGAASAMDNYWRGVMGMYSLMRGIEKASPEVRVALHKSFDLMARHDQVLKAVDNPAVVEQAGKEIVAWFSDYGPESARFWGEARAILPFWLWYVHSMRVMKSMTFKTPVKNALLNNLYRVAPDIVQTHGLTESERERGAVVVQPEGVPLRGKGGGMLTRTAGGFTPFAQAPDLAVTVANIVFKQGREIEGLAFGVVPAVIASTWGKKLNAGFKDYKDQNLIQKNGKQYDPKTLEEVKNVTPEWWQILAQAQFPRIESMARDIKAGEHKAGDLYGQVVKTKEHPEGVPAPFDPFQKTALTFFKSTPTEQTIDEAEEKSMKQYAQREITKAMRRQSFRLDK